MNTEVKVKTYKSPRELERDAEEMARSGWRPQGTSGGGSHFSPVRGTASAVGQKALWWGLAGPLALLAPGKKWRKGDSITVTWVRDPSVGIVRPSGSPSLSQVPASVANDPRFKALARDIHYAQVGLDNANRGRVVGNQDAAIGAAQEKLERLLAKREELIQSASESTGSKEQRDDKTAPDAAATTTGVLVAQLANLTELHENGALTSEEFAAAKAKLLGLDS